MEDFISFGHWVRRRRKALDLTQAALAGQVGCAVITIRKIERDERRPSIQVAELLAEHLQIPETIRKPFLQMSRGHYVETVPSPLATSSQESKLFPTTMKAVSLAGLQVDWGEAPDVTIFYGRQAEMEELTKWLVVDRCRLIGVLGMGGLGKTALVTRLAEQVQDEFQHLIWRSLRNAPPLEELLADWILILSNQETYDLPDEFDKRFSLLLKYLRQKRCLLVLDNVEAILRAGENAGHYRAGYEAYGQLLQLIGDSRHQSSLLLTSREKPRQFGPLEGQTMPVRSLQLASIDLKSGQAILRERGLTGSDESWETLLDRYSGNPLALKLVAETVRELFSGEISEFLQEESIIFGGIWELLSQHFDRLSALEKQLLLWLAIEREAAGVNQLRKNLVRSITQRKLLETLRSLHRRSLLEQTELGFTLQNVVMEFLVDYLVETFSRELANPTKQPLLLNSHALLKGRAKAYVRASQRRLILAPVADRLVDSLGRDGLVATLKEMLVTIRQTLLGQPGYAGGNILNMLIHLESNVSGLDFSGLAVWQAYLQKAALPGVNFSQADLTGTEFTNTFGNVSSVAYSPDGQLLAAGTTDRQVWLWHMPDDQLLHIFEGHTDWVMSVSFSPDGHTLASSSADRTIRLWDVQSGECLNTFSGHTSEVRCVHFSPDGNYLASGSDDQTVRLWDVHTGRLLNAMQGHNNYVRSVCFSPDGNLLASGGNHNVRLWDINNLEDMAASQPLQILNGHTSLINSVSFSPDNNFLASGSLDQTICLWDVKTPREMRASQPLHTLRGHSGWIMSVCFSPDSNLMASSSQDKTVRLWDLATLQATGDGKPLKILQGPTSWIASISFSPDGRTLVGGVADHSVWVWDVHGGKAIKTIWGYSNWVKAVCFSPDGNLLASANYHQTVHLWDFAAISAHFSDNAGDQRQEIDIDRPLKTLQGHTDEVKAVSFSPDSHMLVSCSVDQTVRLWDVFKPYASGSDRAIKILQGHAGEVWCVCFSPDGQLVASSGNKSIHLWDVTRLDTMDAHRPLKSLQGHTYRVMSVCFSPDGTFLASGSDDLTVRLWDIRSGHCLHTFTSHANGVGSVCFSPDGHLLASGSGDGTVRIWDISGERNATNKEAGKPFHFDTHQPLQTLQGHTGWIYSLTFSPDGTILASGSADGSVRLWNIPDNAPSKDVEVLKDRDVFNTGSGPIILQKHTGRVRSVQFSPDGRTLASCSEDETIKFWDWRSGLCFKTIRPPRPYEQMNITGLMGLPKAQKATLKALGAVEGEGFRI